MIPTRGLRVTASFGKAHRYVLLVSHEVDPAYGAMPGSVVRGYLGSVLPSPKPRKDDRNVYFFIEHLYKFLEVLFNKNVTFNLFYD